MLETIRVQNALNTWYKQQKHHFKVESLGVRHKLFYHPSHQQLYIPLKQQQETSQLLVKLCSMHATLVQLYRTTNTESQRVILSPGSQHHR